MTQKLDKILVFLTVIAVVLTSAITTKPVLADDGITGGTPEPVVEETPPAETVAEIIEQLPEGTEIVVVSEDGVEPLASEEAAQIIIEGDPIWCPSSQATPTPGANGCTTSFSTFQALIDALVADHGVNHSGNGVIWVAYDYNNADNAPVVFSGDDLAFLDSLEFVGGWDPFDDSVDSTTPSAMDVSLSIINWTGNVTLNNLNIDAEDAEAGLYVQTAGNITLNNIVSNGNSLGYGAALDTCLFDGTQCAGTGNVVVNDSTFNNNTGGSGLGVDSGGTITLDNVHGDTNGFAGAELYNYDLQGAGGVNIVDSSFSDNHAAGLYVDSAGDITLASIVANNNSDGAVIFSDYGLGNVSVGDSVFNDNTWTGIQIVSAAGINVDHVDASNNSVGGAYLDALGGIGNISVGNNSQFNANGQYGLRAFAKGNITLDTVSVNGDGDPDPLITTPVTDGGAWLKSFDGNVSVSDSLFTNNLDYGLLAVAAGTVDLVNVTATFNGGNGAEVYSIYSFACFGDDNILINVTSGVYTNNGGYGIYAYPGELGNLTLNGPSFLSNTSDANLLGDTFVETLSNPCPEPEPKPIPDGDGKEPNVIDVPEDGQSGPVEQDCELYSSTVFKLHSGTTVKVNCPFKGSSHVVDTQLAGLPGKLPLSLTFADAVTVGLDSEGNPITVLDDGLITLNFHIPEELMGRRLSILYWDPTAKDGQGDWIELPFAQFGGAYFPLYPDNPDDGRLLCSGFSRSGDTVTVTVNFPGTFVLVAR